MKYTSEMYAVSDVQFIPVCLAEEPSQFFTSSGRYWMLSGFYNSNYNHNGLPNDLRPSCGPGPPMGGYGLHPPRSYDPGVVNVLMGDGSVTAVSNSIDARVWAAMGTCSRW